VKGYRADTTNFCRRGTSLGYKFHAFWVAQVEVDISKAVLSSRVKVDTGNSTLVWGDTSPCPATSACTQDFTARKFIGNVNSLDNS
jgi:hypothetical protein